MTLVRNKTWIRKPRAGAQKAVVLSVRHHALAAAAGLATVLAFGAAGASLAAAMPAGFACYGILALGYRAFLAAADDRQGESPNPAPEEKRPDPMRDALLDHLPGLITRHDAAGQLRAVHGAGRAEFGFASSRIAPTGFLNAIHISGRLAYLQAVDRLRQGAETADVEFMMTAPGPDAGLLPVHCRLIAEHGQDGLEGYTAHCENLQALRRLEAEVTQSRSDADSANDAKTRFLAAVSHELRTPLNAILGFSDILIGEYFGAFHSERQKEYVELINQSGNHLLAVVNTMLDMSKIEAGRYELIKEPFPIAQAIRTVDEMLGLQAKTKNVVLGTRIARGLDEVVADRRAIQQVLINLAGNAIKFTPSGGVVTIDAALVGHNLVLSVSDTGIGIPEARLQDIGKPFMQVQNDYTRQYEGTGLGLALVKGLVSLHGGELRIESTEGKGTVVTVLIPADGQVVDNDGRIDFPPRLKGCINEKTENGTAGEYRNGSAEAKIA